MYVQKMLHGFNSLARGLKTARIIFFISKERNYNIGNKKSEFIIFILNNKIKLNVSPLSVLIDECRKLQEPS